MKITEIKEMKNEELIKRIEDEEKNLQDLRFSHQLKQLTNTAKIKLVKKDLARMKTVLRERQILESKKALENIKEGATA